MTPALTCPNPPLAVYTDRQGSGSRWFCASCGAKKEKGNPGWNKTTDAYAPEGTKCGDPFTSP